MRAHIQKTQDRTHSNCVYNRVHFPSPLPYSKPTEFELAPRNQVSLVIIQQEKPICICTFGSDKSETWNGDICDDDSVSQNCPKFIPLQSKEDAEAEFLENLRNDDFVLKTYPDIASLQWVLNQRTWNMRVFSFLWYVRFIFSFITRRFKKNDTR